MGHAYLHNISDFFVRRLYAKGSLTIRECVDALMRAGEKLHAAEGEHDDAPTISLGVEEVVAYLAEKTHPTPRARAKQRRAADDAARRLGGRRKENGPVIVPVDLTDAQSEVLDEWLRHGPGDKWDCGDDGLGGEYGVLDSVRWRFAPGWRNRYPNIPRLGHVEH